MADGPVYRLRVGLDSTELLGGLAQIGQRAEAVVNGINAKVREAQNVRADGGRVGSIDVAGAQREIIQNFQAARQQGPIGGGISRTAFESRLNAMEQQALAELKKQAAAAGKQGLPVDTLQGQQITTARNEAAAALRRSASAEAIISRNTEAAAVATTKTTQAKQRTATEAEKEANAAKVAANLSQQSVTAEQAAANARRAASQRAAANNRSAFIVGPDGARAPDQLAAFTDVQRQQAEDTRRIRREQRAAAESAERARFAQERARQNAEARNAEFRARDAAKQAEKERASSPEGLRDAGRIQAERQQQRAEGNLVARLGAEGQALVDDLRQQGQTQEQINSALRGRLRAINNARAAEEAQAERARQAAAREAARQADPVAYAQSQADEFRREAEEAAEARRERVQRQAAELDSYTTQDVADQGDVAVRQARLRLAQNLYEESQVTQADIANHAEFNAQRARHAAQERAMYQRKLAADNEYIAASAEESRQKRRVANLKRREEARTTTTGDNALDANATYDQQLIQARRRFLVNERLLGLNEQQVGFASAQVQAENDLLKLQGQIKVQEQRIRDAKEKEARAAAAAAGVPYRPSGAGSGIPSAPAGAKGVAHTLWESVYRSLGVEGVSPSEGFGGIKSYFRKASAAGGGAGGPIIPGTPGGGAGGGGGGLGGLLGGMGGGGGGGWITGLVGAGASFIGQKLITTAGYAIAGSILYGSIQTIREAFQELDALERKLGEVDAALQGIGQGEQLGSVRATILSVSSSTGQLASELANLSETYIGFFGDANTANRALEGTAELMLITGLNAEQAEAAVIAYANAFNQGADAAKTFSNLVAASAAVTGSEQENIAEAFSKVAPVLQEQGATQEQSVALIGALLQRNGQRTDKAVEDLNRALPQFQQSRTEILSIRGLRDIETAGRTNFDILAEVVKRSDKLREADRTRLFNLLGGGSARNVGSFVALGGADINNLAGRIGEDDGQSAEIIRRRNENTVGFQARRAGRGVINEIGAVLANTGVTQGLTDLLRTLADILQIGLQLTNLAGALARPFLELFRALTGATSQREGVDSLSESIADFTGFVEAALRPVTELARLIERIRAFSTGEIEIGMPDVPGWFRGLRRSASNAWEGVQGEESTGARQRREQEERTAAQERAATGQSTTGGRQSTGTQGGTYALDLANINELGRVDVQALVQVGVATRSQYAAAIRRDREIVRRQIEEGQVTPENIKLLADLNKELDQLFQQEQQIHDALSNLHTSRTRRGDNVLQGQDAERLARDHLEAAGGIEDPQERRAARLRAQQELTDAQERIYQAEEQRRVALVRLAQVQNPRDQLGNIQSAISSAKVALQKARGADEAIAALTELATAENQLIEYYAGHRAAISRLRISQTAGTGGQVDRQAALIEARNRAADELFRAQSSRADEATIARLQGDLQEANNNLAQYYASDRDAQSAARTAANPNNALFAIQEGIRNQERRISEIPEGDIQGRRAAQNELTNLQNQEAEIYASMARTSTELAAARSPKDVATNLREAVVAAQRDVDRLKNAGTEERERAAIALANAQNAANDYMIRVADSIMNLRIATAEAAGDPVEAARLRLEAARTEVERANGVNDPERQNNAQAALRTAQRAAWDAQLNDRIGDIEFGREMNEISIGQAVAMYEALLTDTNLTKEQRQNILRKIKSLRDEAGRDMMFNVPTDIRLPTLYEARRVMQSGGPGGYQDNRQVVVYMNVNNGMDQSSAQQFLADAFGQSARVTSGTGGPY